MGGRTFVIGDIHGDLRRAQTLLGKLPALDARTRVVFLGDYLDRGPDPKGVVERVRAFCAETPARAVALRGNHEDKWVQSYDKPDLAFLLQWGNGCAQTLPLATPAASRRARRSRSTSRRSSG